MTSRCQPTKLAHSAMKAISMGFFFLVVCVPSLSDPVASVLLKSLVCPCIQGKEYRNSRRLFNDQCSECASSSCSTARRSIYHSDFAPVEFFFERAFTTVFVERVIYTYQDGVMPTANIVIQSWHSFVLNGGSLVQWKRERSPISQLNQPKLGR